MSFSRKATVFHRCGFTGEQVDFDVAPGKDFDPLKPIFYSRYIFETKMLDHFGIWRRMYEGPKITDYAFMSLLPDIVPRLVFNSQQSLDLFDGWMDNYISRFFGTVETALLDTFPRLKNYGEVQGIVMPIPERMGSTYKFEDFDNSVTTDALSIWCWIVQNCSHRVYITRGHVIMQDKDEAFSFRLRWLS